MSASIFLFIRFEQIVYFGVLEKLAIPEHCNDARNTICTTHS